MKTKGLEPDVVSLCTLIIGLCKIGDLDRARQLFTRMKEQMHVMLRNFGQGMSALYTIGPSPIVDRLLY
ncbi:hypothetical protein VNO78_23773 [Psophocarpus tetragonolobus]|uniref:Pentatricopeptide repeat-containing protein n=1 Tax=Psophocarpus tetragonolobus TaxID=3891 RepID=A0AAN9S7B0_PSOTE